jgi:Gnt-I system high-affinity gluconate transporter
MVPLIFSVIYQYKLPAVYIGLPTLAALSVTHGFLPPHPSPVVLVGQFNANMGITLIYGLIVAIPAVIIAGPVFAGWLKNIPTGPLQLFQGNTEQTKPLPGKLNSFLTALLPVFLLMITTILPKNNFTGDAPIVMLFCLLIATFTLGILQQTPVKAVMSTYTEAVKDVAMILLIIAGAGALKEVLAQSGVSEQIAGEMQTWPVHPLILGWLMAAIIRACVGSATIAGITAAGMVAPLVLQGLADPNLMVLSVGAGSLMFSHVNDAGFWMFKEYFNLSLKNTLLSWSVMETIVGIVGLAGVMILDTII